MPDPRLVRKAMFKAALEFAGMSAIDFAATQGISVRHLRAVLNEGRESGRLTSEIDAFIDMHIKQVA